MKVDKFSHSEKWHLPQEKGRATMNLPLSSTGLDSHDDPVTHPHKIEKPEVAP